MDAVNATGAGGGPAYYPSQDAVGAEGSSGQLDSYIPPEGSDFVRDPLGFIGFGIINVVGGILAGGWGCAPVVEPKDPSNVIEVSPEDTSKVTNVLPDDLPGVDISSQVHMEITVELPGDPKNIGHILNIKNAHETSKLPSDTESLLLYLEIAQYQLQILKTLESLEPKPKYIFFEDTLTKSIDPEEARKIRVGLDKFSSTEVLESLSGPLPDNIIYDFVSDYVKGTINLNNPLFHQVIYLHQVGAPTIYALRNQSYGVKLRATTNEKIREEYRTKYAKKLSKWTSGILPQDPDLMHFLRDRREEVATKRMIKFLQNNPGERIILIYGAGHHFADDFRKYDFTPRLVSLSWHLPSTPRINQLMQKMEEASVRPIE